MIVTLIIILMAVIGLTVGALEMIDYAYRRGWLT